MMKFRGLVVAALAAGLFGVFAIDASAFNKEPKYTLKEIMKAQKDGFFKKAAGKDATAEDKEKLVEYAQALCETPCPKGDAEDWKTKVKAVLDAAKKVQKGEKGAGKELAKANNCKACHDSHK